METKVVKFEIGKLLAVVITVVVVAVLATIILNGRYFKGNLMYDSSGRPSCTGTNEVLQQNDAGAWECVTAITTATSGSFSTSDQDVTKEQMPSGKVVVCASNEQAIGDSCVQRCAAGYEIKSYANALEGFACCLAGVNPCSIGQAIAVAKDCPSTDEILYSSGCVQRCDDGYEVRTDPSGTEGFRCCEIGINDTCSEGKKLAMPLN